MRNNRIKNVDNFLLNFGRKNSEKNIKFIKNKTKIEGKKKTEICILCNKNN